MMDQVAARKTSVPWRLTANREISPLLILIVAYAFVALGAPLTKWLVTHGGGTADAMAMKMKLAAMAGKAVDAAPPITFCSFLFIGNLSAGFGTGAGLGAVHTDIVWAKLAALAEGARLASDRLWGR